MALIGTPAAFEFDSNRHVMILNVPESQANLDWVNDAFNRAEIGDVYTIFVYGPFENGLFRIEVALNWFTPSQTAYNWQGTMLDPKLKAQLYVTSKISWILIPVPHSTQNNQLWQEESVVKTPAWYTNTKPETEVLTMENLASSTRAMATLMLTETEPLFTHAGAPPNTPTRADYITLAL